VDTLTVDTDEPKLTDWRGNDYGVGDLVLYPRASGRSLEMQVGTVVAIKPYGYKRYPYDDSDEVEEMRHKVVIHPINSSRFSTGGYRSVEKDVTITITTNITAL